MNGLHQFVINYYFPLVISIGANLITHFLTKYGANKKKRWIGITSLILTLAAAFVGPYLVWRWMNKPIEADPVFSNFNQTSPKNHYGVEWRVFNDSAVNGNSYVTIENPTYTNDDKYAVVSFNLGEKSTDAPYCGVVSGFSERLGEPRDISVFQGIQLEVWREEDLPPNVHVYLQISPSQLIGGSDNFCQYDITDHVRKHNFTDHTKQDGNRSEIAVSFSKFGDPPWHTGPPTSFDKSLQAEVYQIAIGIRGEKGQSRKGKIAFDNLAFYR